MRVGLSYTFENVSFSELQGLKNLPRQLCLVDSPLGSIPYRRVKEAWIWVERTENHQSGRTSSKWLSLTNQSRPQLVLVSTLHGLSTNVPCKLNLHHQTLGKEVYFSYPNIIFSNNFGSWSSISFIERMVSIMYSCGLRDTQSSSWTLTLACSWLPTWGLGCTITSPAMKSKC